MLGGTKEVHMSQAEKPKSLPYCQQSERYVLASCIASINALNAAAPALAPSDFFFSEHKVIFQALQTFFYEDKAVDCHLLGRYLIDMGLISAAGGMSSVLDLVHLGGAAHTEAYVEIVKNKSCLRQGILAIQEIEKKMLAVGARAGEAIDDAHKMLERIAGSSSVYSPQTIATLLSGGMTRSGAPFLTDLQERQERFRVHGSKEPILTGLPTGFIDLDKMLNGLNKTNLIILAARPGIGKTALALNIALHACLKAKTPVLFFTLEMSAEEIGYRLISANALVSTQKMKDGSLNGEEFQRIVQADSVLKGGQFIIEDERDLRITELRTRARRYKEVYGIGLVVVDYIQLLRGSGAKISSDNKQAEVSEISRMLKVIAGELDIPILCLSQLNRDLEKGEAERDPKLSDLRDSGAIEQDSDIVLFVTRKDAVDPMNSPGIAELIVAKNRHGTVGRIKLVYRKEFTKFENHSPIPKSEQPSEDAYERFK